MSASVGSLVATLPAVLAGLSASIGVNVRRNRPESELETKLWEGGRCLRNDGEVTDEETGRVVPTGWRGKAFRPGEGNASRNSDREVLAAHNAETISSPESQTNPREACQPAAIRSVRHISGRISHPCAPAGGGKHTQTRECAKIRPSSQSGPGAFSWLRTNPVNAPRVIASRGILYAGRRHIWV